MLLINSSVAVCLSTMPEVPYFIACTYSPSSSEAVSTMILVFSFWACTRCSRESPSTPGMRRSSSRMSGSFSSMRLSTSEPSLASATTSKSGSRLNSRRSPSRKMVWSSARAILIAPAAVLFSGIAAPTLAFNDLLRLRHYSPSFTLSAVSSAPREGSRTTMSGVCTLLPKPQGLVSGLWRTIRARWGVSRALRLQVSKSTAAVPPRGAMSGGYRTHDRCPMAPRGCGRRSRRPQGVGSSGVKCIPRLPCSRPF